MLKKGKKMKLVRLVVAIALFSVVFGSSVVEADSRVLQLRLKPYVPGTKASIEVIVKNAESYDLKIEYGGLWWGGGSGPASAQCGSQYWMICGPWGGCAEWWKGMIPPHEKEVITIPVTTSLMQAEFQGGVWISGTIDGQQVSAVFNVKTR